MPLHGKTICLITIAILAPVGCVERKLTVTSEPEGALVLLNNQELGRTPLTRDFTWYGNYDVRLCKEGYQTLKTQHSLIAPWWQWVPFDLVADVTPFWWKDERTMAFRMEPASTQAADPQVMLTRATEMQAQLQSSQFTRPATTQPSTAPATQHARPTTR
jgi:hypothetical protein